MVEKEFLRLVEIMKKLRSLEGCDWDREQTHESLKPYLLEEAYEVIYSIDNRNFTELKEELGDVLLQVIFHSTIAEENEEFTLLEVIRILNEKLIRRHPHVFGSAKGYSYARWEEIKAQEKGKKKRTSVGDVNSALPSLSLARRIQENAADVGFDWDKEEQVWDVVFSEIDELKKADTQEEMEEEFGDLLFTLVNLSRFINVDPEISLRKATEKFLKRFEVMENLIEEEGKNLQELELDELDKYWNKAKTILLNSQESTTPPYRG